MAAVDYTADVSTHSRLKAAGPDNLVRFKALACFNTQPPKGGWKPKDDEEADKDVSTHSRLKAAGIRAWPTIALLTSFNTQPPKGGWTPEKLINLATIRFQHTAA